MTDFDLDLRELETFMKELDDLQQHFPKEARQVMLRSGTKARAIVMRKVQQLVRKVTGKYYKSIKRGKVWVDADAYKVRVYSAAPHAHLIEYGHRIVGHEPNKPELGYKEGYHVFDRAAREIDAQWTNIITKEFDRIMDKI